MRKDTSSSFGGRALFSRSCVRRLQLIFPKETDAIAEKKILPVVPHPQNGHATCLLVASTVGLRHLAHTVWKQSRRQGSE